jgi:hypothetical protein
MNEYEKQSSRLDQTAQRNEAEDSNRTLQLTDLALTDEQLAAIKGGMLSAGRVRVSSSSGVNASV